MIEDRVNINGEFLGISALAVYSAPWFLQLLLLMLVVALFFIKLFRDSSQLRAFTKAINDEESEHYFDNVSRAFFGFTVTTKNVAAYWVGFLIYIVTLFYAIYNTYVHVFT